MRNYHIFFLLTQSLAQLNESIPEYQHSLSLEPTSEQVLSIYSSVLCEVRKLEASIVYSDKLDETQAKLDLFYEKVELVKKSHIVEKGQRGQWDIDTSRRSGGCGLTILHYVIVGVVSIQNDVISFISIIHTEKTAAVKEEDGEEEIENEEVSSEGEGEGGREGESEGEREVEGEESSSTVEEQDGDSVRNNDAKVIDDIGSDSVESDSVQDTHIEVLGNGTDSSEMGHNRGNSRFRLVLRPLEDSECSRCESGTSPKSTPPVPNSGTFQIGPPVCRLPSPFLNYSRYPSGYCADTLRDCAEIEKMGRPGTNICEVKGETTIFTYQKDKCASSLNCAIDENNQSDCLKALKEQLRLAEQRRLVQRERVMKNEQAKRDAIINDTGVKSDKGDSSSKPSVSASIDDKSPDNNKGGTARKTKESEYSLLYRELEFLPYNPLPIEMEELIFPERSRPLAMFDDPYWPNKVSCVKLVESLKGASAGLSTFTGTYLSPEAKGIE